MNEMENTFFSCKENRINNISNMFGLQDASNLACTAVFYIVFSYKYVLNILYLNF